MTNFETSSRFGPSRPWWGRLSPRRAGRGIPRAEVREYQEFWQGWEDQHLRAEEQTDTRAPDRDWMPVVELYVDGPHLNTEMGWLVDA